MGSYGVGEGVFGSWIRDDGGGKCDVGLTTRAESNDPVEGAGDCSGTGCHWAWYC